MPLSDFSFHQSGSASNLAFQPHQHGRKRKGQSLLPTRTSPRKRVNVRLFGAREVVRDGQERAEEVAVQSQEIQPTENARNEHELPINEDEDQTTHAQQPEEVESIHAQQSENEGPGSEMDNTDKEVKKDMIEYLQDRLVELRDSTSLSVDEIFMLVLPSKSATFRGLVSSLNQPDLVQVDMDNI
ncbi:hypothetical protein FNV43_RR04420 [Rhamnella rubrinervis]|uniref:Uncharacterized protein n=1 Tax=Rhamnella rubrinervis TaxID=2594499 RepID=A0A8K0HKZ9_9ROSA|nr:hypothetical protein FNV43_RR04420 [Rhamnella rubrinervis]